ncbi:MAG: hypothetical protein HFG80_11860 [Eubacterium sp.]|nr:hypothetical protein [Eubacterium sp.]
MDRSWIRFTETGKIEDYLNYCREEKTSGYFGERNMTGYFGEEKTTGYRRENKAAGSLYNEDAGKNGYEYCVSRYGASGASNWGI